MRSVTRRGVLGFGISVLGGGVLAGCSAVKQAAGIGTANHGLTIDSDSMAPTLVEGQTIAVDWLTSGSYQPHRQDIVVLHPTAEYQGLQQSALIVRRVIGVPGDTVSCIGVGGSVFVNGVALHEPYLYSGNVPSAVQFDVQVPAGCLWLLGDHRAVALDCRYHLDDPDHGAIPIANVVGIYRPSA